MKDAAAANLQLCNVLPASIHHGWKKGGRGSSFDSNPSATENVKYSSPTFAYILFGQRQRGGGASFRSADAAQVCNNVGFVAVGFVKVDGAFECSVAIAARQIVSERW